MNLNQFSRAVLQGLGVPVTSGALQAMEGWARAEGGHYHNSARYNPLNTTQKMPGSQTFRSVGQGAADIGIYRDWGQGVQATVKTLNNGLYGGIISALRKGDPIAVGHAIDSSRWGTHSATSAISGTKAPAAGATPDRGPGAGAGARGASAATSVTTPGVDNRVARAQLIQNFLKNSNRDPLYFAQQARALADVPAQTVTTPAAPGASSPAPAPAGGAMPTGTASFEGKKVAAWIAPILTYARKQGWKGAVNSGFRSFADQTRIYNSGVRPAAVPGTSNHEGADFPRGAVDVSDAAQLSAILRRSPYASRLQWAGSKDPVHFSHPHGGSY